MNRYRPVIFHFFFLSRLEEWYNLSRFPLFCYYPRGKGITTSKWVVVVEYSQVPLPLLIFNFFSWLYSNSVETCCNSKALFVNWGVDWVAIVTSGSRVSLALIFITMEQKYWLKPSICNFRRQFLKLEMSEKYSINNKVAVYFGS